MVKLISANYIKSSEVKEGDIIEFKDGGQWQENLKFKKPDGSPQYSFVISVEYKGETKSLSLNGTSRASLITGYGNDTESWIGKKAKLSPVPGFAGGKQVTMLFVKPMESGERKWSD